MVRPTNKSNPQVTHFDPLEKLVNNSNSSSCDTTNISQKINSKSSLDPREKPIQNPPELSKILTVDHEEQYDIGLDISTTTTGVCILGENGVLKSLSALKLNTSKLDNLWKKADHVTRGMGELLDGLGIKKRQIRRVFVEENAKRFTPGFSSADTILTLAKFNGIVCYVMYTLLDKVSIMDINVSSARAKLKLKIDRSDKTLTVKEKVFNEMIKVHPEFPWPKHIAKTGKSVGQEVYDTCARDMCDAYVICRGGQLIHG